MPTKRFTNLQQIGPVVAEVDSNDDVILGGAASQTYDALDHQFTEVDDASNISINNFGFSADDLASAQRARISARFGGGLYVYVGAALNADNGHPIPINTTVILVGNAAINALLFRAAPGDGTTIIVTLEG